ncbi:MAG TPA: hypothetical protein VM282_12525, partial [Acidimicrobiales bacterium]|nr:hypothetical protein [Acidimicrobiales bacterium]
ATTNSASTHEAGISVSQPHSTNLRRSSDPHELQPRASRHPIEQRNSAYPLAQAGWGFGADEDGAFAYFDTVDDFGCYYEAILGSRALREPDAHIAVTGPNA